MNTKDQIIASFKFLSLAFVGVSIILDLNPKWAIIPLATTMTAALIGIWTI